MGSQERVNLVKNLIHQSSRSSGDMSSSPEPVEMSTVKKPSEGSGSREMPSQGPSRRSDRSDRTTVRSFSETQLASDERTPGPSRAMDRFDIGSLPSDMREAAIPASSREIAVNMNGKRNAAFVGGQAIEQMKFIEDGRGEDRIVSIEVHLRQNDVSGSIDTTQPPIFYVRFRKCRLRIARLEQTETIGALEQRIRDPRVRYLNLEDEDYLLSESIEKKAIEFPPILQRPTLECLKQFYSNYFAMFCLTIFICLFILFALLISTIHEVSQATENVHNLPMAVEANINSTQ